MDLKILINFLLFIKISFTLSIETLIFRTNAFVKVVAKKALRMLLRKLKMKSKNYESRI